MYRKIPIISPGAYFWSKGLFEKNFLGGLIFFGGGGGGLYIDEYLCFEKATFCSSNSKFLKFSAYNMSLLLVFFTFLFLIMYLQLSIPHCIVKYLPPKFNVMFKFNYSKYNPGEGLIHGRSFPFQKLVPKRPWLIHGRAYRNFTVYYILVYSYLI